MLYVNSKIHRERLFEILLRNFYYVTRAQYSGELILWGGARCFARVTTGAYDLETLIFFINICRQMCELNVNSKIHRQRLKFHNINIFIQSTYKLNEK